MCTTIGLSSHIHSGLAKMFDAVAIFKVELALIGSFVAELIVESEGCFLTSQGSSRGCVSWEFHDEPWVDDRKTD